MYSCRNDSGLHFLHHIALFDFSISVHSRTCLHSLYLLLIITEAAVMSPAQLAIKGYEYQVAHLFVCQVYFWIFPLCINKVVKLNLRTFVLADTVGDKGITQMQQRYCSYCDL